MILSIEDIKKEFDNLVNNIYKVKKVLLKYVKLRLMICKLDKIKKTYGCCISCCIKNKSKYVNGLEAL